jgi:hypothetical protein
MLAQSDTCLMHRYQCSVYDKTILSVVTILGLEVGNNLNCEKRIGYIIPNVVHKALL